MTGVNRLFAAGFGLAVWTMSATAVADDSFDTVSIAGLVATGQPSAQSLSILHADAEGAVLPTTCSSLYTPAQIAYRAAFQGLVVSTLSMMDLLAAAAELPRGDALDALDVNGDSRLDLLDFAAIEASGQSFDSARAGFRDISGTGFLSGYWDLVEPSEDRDISGTGFDLILEVSELLVQDRDISGTGFDLILDLGEQMQEERDISGTGFDAVLEQLGRLQVNRDISGTGRVAADSFDILGQQVINAMNRLAVDDVAGAGAELVLGYLAAAAMLTED